MAIKVGHHIIGLKGTIEGRKGYIVHIEADEVWLQMDSGEIMTGVPKDAFQGRKGRPANVHSIIAQKRVQYSSNPALRSVREKFAGSADASDFPVPVKEPEVIVLSPEVQGNGEYVALVGRVAGEAVSATAEYFEAQPHVVRSEDDLEQEDNAPRAESLAMAVIAREEEKVKPKLALVGEDGNAFMILARALNAGKKAGWTQAQINEFKSEATSGDYDNLLATVCKHFDVDSDEDED